MPPAALSTAFEPLHTLGLFTLGDDNEPIEATTSVRKLSQLPATCETKNEVVDESDGVEYELFTSPARAEPPEALRYHR